MSISNDSHGPIETLTAAFDKRMHKIVQVDPLHCLTAINPRSEEELEWESLLPRIIAERGVILDPIMIWALEPSDPLWETLGNGKFAKMSEDDKKGKYILIRGHRRCTSIVHVKNNRDKFPADILDNAQTVPAIILKGITLERAEELALDEEAKKSLRSWECVKVIFGMYRKDYKPNDVAMAIPQMIYRALNVKGGEGAYTEASKVFDGNERNKRFCSELRNNLDTWLLSCALFGPAAETQLLLWFKKHKDRRPLLEGERLLVDFKYVEVGKLRKIYNNTRDNGWTPITRIDVDDTGEPIVEGGDSFKDEKGIVIEGSFNAALKKNIRELRDPSQKASVARMPNKNDRDNVRSNGRSTAHKLAAAFFCGLPSENRQQEDDRAYFREVRETIRTEKREKMCPVLQALIDVENSERDLAKIEEAWDTLDSILRAQAETITKLRVKVEEASQPKGKRKTVKA
jgi:hypothetical protein